MSPDMDNMAGEAAGLPFARPIVRHITEELFRGQSQWKSGELANRVVQLHRERGGVLASNPKFTVSRVLQDLRDDGLVISPGHGWWRWTGSSEEGQPNPEESEIIATASIDEAIDDLEPTIRPEREVGTGRECVYLYFNPNDRRLAELEGRDVWECKIGRTSSSDAISRILGQGIRTALSHVPTVGLVLRTDDSAALEKVLHSSLRLIEAEVPESPGVEWFITSPARVEAWFAIFQNALVAIGRSSSNLSWQSVAHGATVPLNGFRSAVPASHPSRANMDDRLGARKNTAERLD